jgi:hypothetical protein
MLLALHARGYSELRSRLDPLACSSARFKISPTHARRLDAQASIVELGDGGAVRLGRLPMPRAMRESLYLEGEAIAKAQASTPRQPITLADLGL